MTAPQPLIILGCGGGSRDVVDIVEDINAAASQPLYELLGYLDDDAARQGQSVAGLPVLGRLNQAVEFSAASFVNGIGNPENYLNKPAIIGKTCLAVERFVTLVHPQASVSQRSSLGAGSVIYPNVTIGQGVHIGRHVCILPQCVVSHDCQIGDYTCLAGGVALSGEVRVGLSCYLGSNCSVKGRLQLGNGCLVGMGATVLQSVAASAVVVGNPARTLVKAQP